MALTSTTARTDFPTRLAGVLPAVGVALYAIVFFKNAWVGDDAYILFRSLEQLLDGQGPRWNPHERVQVFTCPLWYGLLALLGILHRDPYLNSILLSAACNAWVIWQLFRLLPGPANRFLALVLLTFSQAYFDFTSSGLENPLSYALLASVARYALLEDLPATVRHTRLLLAAGLLVVTRHDLVLLVAPLLAYAVGGLSGRDRWRGLLLLGGPLLCWTAFSLAYYGFPFPNTAYAKLGLVVSRSDLLHRGLLYFQTSILRDLPSLVILAAGLYAGLSGDRRSRLLAAGILLHLAYVLWIGGDFMRGRFFSWDILLCTILLLRTALPTTPPWRALANPRSLLLLCTMALGTWLWEPPVVTPVAWGAKPFAQADTADGVTQERHFFFRYTSLARYLRKGDAMLEDHGWCVDSREQQRLGLTVGSSTAMGFRGYCLGTRDVVIDMLGITDPLLARLPKNPSQANWRPGHFLRLLPDGYCSSVKQGRNLVSDPLLHAYYEDLRLLTQAEPLFTLPRWQAIWRMNTGAHRASLQQIHAQLIERFAAPDSKAWIKSTRKDCPFVILPDALMEQLRHVQLD